MGDPVTTGCNTCDEAGLGYESDGSGGCVLIDVPLSSDLLITEFMLQPEGSTSQAVGQYFEIVNISGIRLNLAGMTVNLSGTDIVLPATPAQILEIDSYLVFGASDNVAENGGAAVDVELTGFPLLAISTGSH